jgi:tetratricopeptide (TPR) repeat protein
METKSNKKSISPQEIVLRIREKRNHLHSPPKKDTRHMEVISDKKSISPTDVMLKITEGEKHLRKGNLFSSIVTFREVLNLFINMKNASQKDRTALTGVINDVQRKLAASREFTDLYGKVFFRDDDFATSYDFLCQLITIKEEEIANVLVNEEVSQSLNLDYLGKEDQKTTKLMVSLVERGELSVLRELVAAHDGLGSLILSFYNEAGISQRKAGNIDKAIVEYKKALSVSPNDEHVYYNMARAYIEIGQKRNAEVSIGQALQINPQFQEGLILQKYIQQWSR